VLWILLFRGTNSKQLHQCPERANHSLTGSRASQRETVEKFLKYNEICCSIQKVKEGVVKA
jgi:hypothetical protein